MSWLAILGWGSLAFWGTMSLFTLVNLLTFRRPESRRAAAVLRRLGVDDPADAPAVSIVIPARDEERAVGATLEAALACDWPKLQVILVDDESTDATARIAGDIAAADPRLTVVAGQPPPPGWLGKPHALAQGAEAATGDWLLFMDADVRLSPDAVATTVGHATRHGLDHLALFPRFERRGFWEELLMPLLSQALWMYFPSFLSRWPRLRELAFGSGSFNLVRASAYRAIGGHRALAASVVDDIRLAVELKSAGYASALELGDRLASIRMYHGAGEIFAGFEKNAHALLAHRPLLWMLNLTLGTVLNLAPFAWLPVALAAAAGWVAPGLVESPGSLALLAALALALLCRVSLQVRLGYPRWVALLHPLGVLASIWISFGSLRAAYGQGVVRWRGREYRREETDF